MNKKYYFIRGVAAPVVLVGSLLGLVLIGSAFYKLGDFKKLSSVQESNLLASISQYAEDANTALSFHVDNNEGVSEFSSGIGDVVSGPDGLGQAAYFTENFFQRLKPLTFIPYSQNWTEGTVEFWLKPEKYPSGNQWLIAFNWFSSVRPSSGYVGEISLTPEGKINDNCGWEWSNGGKPPQITSKSVVPLNTWSHVAISWSKTGGYTRIYLNNNLDSEIPQACARASNGNIYPWLAGYGGYVGAMDELRISKVARPAPFYSGEPGTVVTPAIKVLSPNGGEIWLLNHGYDIKFQQSGLSGQAKVILIKQGQESGAVCLLKYLDFGKDIDLANVDLSSGCLNKSEFGDITPGNYKINVYAGGLYDGNVIQDSSDAPFTITAQTVSEQVKCVFNGSTAEQKCYTATDYTSPYYSYGCSSGSTGACTIDLKGAKGDKITWKSSCGGYAYTTMDGISEYAEFSCGPTTVSSPKITSFTAYPLLKVNDGSNVFLDWTTENSNSIMITDGNGAMIAYNLPPSGSYTVYPKVTTTYTITAAGKTSDLGSAKKSVTVLVAPSIKVLSPSGGSVILGSTQTIKWTSENYPASSLLNIELLRFASGVVGYDKKEIANNVVNDGSENWLVTSDFASDPQYTYKINIYDPDGLGIESSSPLPFTIVAPTTSESILKSLNVSKSGNGKVTGSDINCGTICSKNYPASTTVILTATPDSGFTLASWSGCTSTTSTCSILMDANKSVTANFVSAVVQPTVPDLTVSLNTDNPQLTAELGQQSVVLLKLNFTAGGEDVAVKQLHLQLTSGSPSDLDGQSVTLWTLDGAQVGRAIFATGRYATSSALSNFVVPKGKTAVLMVRGAISKSTKPGTLIKVDYDGDNIGINGNYGVGQTSGKTILPAGGDTKSGGVLIREVGSTAALIPKITSIVEPATIKAGEGAVLKWATENAASVSINQGIGPVEPSGSVKVSPSFTTKYTITAASKSPELVSGSTQSVVLTVLPAGEQTAEGLQSQINALLDPIKKLQEQIKLQQAQPPSAPASLPLSTSTPQIKVTPETTPEELGFTGEELEEAEEFSYTWSEDLYYGLTDNEDVAALQYALVIEGCFRGSTTGNFFRLTRDGVICFQKKHNFTNVPGTGYVGSYTRKVLNDLYSK